MNQEHLLLNRQLLRITGGYLHTPGTGGFLEFRTIPSSSCLLTSVQDYVPRLPQFIYRWTQALLHLWIMKRFGNDLKSR